MAKATCMPMISVSTLSLTVITFPSGFCSMVALDQPIFSPLECTAYLTTRGETSPASAGVASRSTAVAASTSLCRVFIPFI